MEIGSGIGAPLVAAGASAALAFIVLLILGIALVALVSLGSAIVVLERFARVATRPVWFVFSALVVSALCGLMLLALPQPELSARPWAEWGAVFFRLTAQARLLSLIAVLLTRFTLGRLDGRRLS